MEFFLELCKKANALVSLTRLNYLSPRRGTQDRNFFSRFVDQQGHSVHSLQLHHLAYKENLWRKTDLMAWNIESTSLRGTMTSGNSGKEALTSEANSLRDLPPLSSKFLCTEALFTTINSLYEASVQSVSDRRARKMMPFRLRVDGLTDRQKELSSVLQTDLAWAALIQSLNVMLTNKNSYDRRLVALLPQNTRNAVAGKDG